MLNDTSAAFDHGGPGRGITEVCSVSALAQGVRAISDILEGMRLWHVWGTLGWLDIRQRYRRSKIGPFWLTISMGVMTGAIGIVYAGLFKTDAAQFLPHVAIGFVVWGLIFGLINDGCNAFIEGQASIKQLRLPISVYVYRVVWRNLIIFGHNFLIILIVVLIFNIRAGWISLLAVPGIAILFLNGFWVGLLLGLLSARFRDVPQIVVNTMQLVFFVTPIIWQPDLLSGRQFVLTFNPFFYAVEIVRGPLLGTPPPLLYWLTILALTLASAAVALAMYARFRWRIPYWI
jgi:ABC-type polysaccharide/polyol phosphate export permease